MRKKLNILKAKEKGSIYTLVIHNFIRLAVIVLILAAVFGGVGWILMPQKVEPAGIKKLIRRVNSAENDDYSSINTVKLLGRNGYFEITDNKAKVLFTSDSQHKNTYNKDILQYLPLVDTDVVYDLLPLENGEKQGSLLVRHTEDQLTGIAMLDENGKIMYSNLNLKNSQISSETMDYLFYKVDSSNLFIQKYEFLNSKGERRYLLIHSNSDSAGILNAQRVTVVTVIGIYIILLVVLIILTGRRLSARVVAPIRKLTKAIDETAGGNWIQIHEGEEPKEMLEVIRSFNHMEEELRKSEEEQKKLQDQRRKMVADISHDLKTPITVISGYVNALRDGLIPEKEQDKYLEIIQNKTELLTGLINSFSDYSRLDHPGFQLNMEQGDLCEYIREYIAGRYSELEVGGFHLEADLPEKRIDAGFDRMQLRRVFDNILGNAMKYCGPGTTLRIEAGLVMKDDRNYLRVLIGDNGPGIPEKYRASIFDPFVVGNESRTSGKGTGLGLSIAKQIVELHGGSISLTDRPGCVYEIMLPVNGNGH